VAEGLLHEAKEATEARNGSGHAAKLAEDLLPFFRGDALLVAGEGRKNVLEARQASWRELDGTCRRIHEPSEHDFSSGPSGVPFGEFFRGDGLLPCNGILTAQWSEHAINAMEEATADEAEFLCASLSETQEVVHIDVIGLDWPFAWALGMVWDGYSLGCNLANGFAEREALFRGWLRVGKFFQRVRMVDRKRKGGRIGQVGYRLRQGAEVGRGREPTHGKGERECHEGNAIRTCRKGDSQRRDIVDGRPKPVESVGDINLYHVHGPVPRVCMNDRVEDAV
jgi:hypothetical protein